MNIVKLDEILVLIDTAFETLKDKEMNDTYIMIMESEFDDLKSIIGSVSCDFLENYDENSENYDEELDELIDCIQSEIKRTRIKITDKIDESISIINIFYNLDQDVTQIMNNIPLGIFYLREYFHRRIFSFKRFIYKSLP